MPSSTYFYQECPTCGRQLQIRVEYLGKQVVCQHCRGKLVAMDAVTARHGKAGPSNALLERAEALLQSTADRRRGA